MAGYLLLGIVAIEGLEGDSNHCSLEYSSTLFRGSVGFPKLRLFLRFHKFHNTMVMSSGSFVLAHKINKVSEACALLEDIMVP